MRGKLIVFEGLDRSGKSTQCERLVENLIKTGRKVRLARFPDRTTPIGMMINSYLKGHCEQEDHVIHLLFSANSPSIESDIAAGITVIVDRYYYSGCVYSAAKNNPSLPLAWARHPEVGLPRPDVCLFLDLSAQEAAKRGGFGDERYESDSTQARVREQFGVLREGPEKDDFVLIDAGQGQDEVEKAIFEAVIKVIEDVDAGELPLRRVEAW